MDITKTIGEITGFLKEDTPESAKTALETVKREFETMQISLKSANEESKSRKEKIRTLQEQLEENEAKIVKLSDDSKYKTMQTEYETKLSESQNLIEQLLNDRKQLHSIFKSEMSSKFQKVVEHPNFEKVKDKLRLPAMKDGKWDFDSMVEEDIVYNKAKLAEYEDLGLFEVGGAKQGYAMPKTEKPEEVNIVELAKKNPAEARKWLDKKRGRNVLFR